MSDVIVVIGAGSIGQAIARRVSAGKHVVPADLRSENVEAAAEVLRDAGFTVTTTTVDISSRSSIRDLVETATVLGDITGLIHAAGVSPSQAPPATILAVDLYGTAVILEELGNVIATGGSGVVIASQSGHRLGALTAEQDAALATTAPEDLLALPMLQPDQVTDSLHAYQLAKRANSLRVMAEAVRWAKRGARINTISPGIIMSPLANDELYVATQSWYLHVTTHQQLTRRWIGCATLAATIPIAIVVPRSLPSASSRSHSPLSSPSPHGADPRTARDRRRLSQGAGWLTA